MNTQLTIPDPKASLASVPDPTDWDNTKFPLLNPLDSALRCDICKDFYNSPVITNCLHTFCSGCIRRALNAEQICPICRSGEQEYRLRKNPVVQELVDAFLSARPKLLEVAMEVVPVQVQQVDSSLSSQSEGEEPSSPPSKRSRPSSRVTRSTRTTPKYTDEHGDDIVEVPAPSDGLVPCPSCQKRMKMEMVDSHLDSCLSDEYKPSKSSSQPSLPLRTNPTRSSKSTSSSSTPAAPLQPLPKISYSFLKEKDLRNKLTDLGIPSGGPRKLLQERHSEWMTIWNANVDAKRPRSKRELLAELTSWERAHLQPSNQPVKARWSDDQWKNAHGDQFETLIKEAKARAEAARKEKAEDAAKGGAQGEEQKGVDEAASEAERANGMDTYSGGPPERLKDGNIVEGVDLAAPPAEAVAPIPGSSVDGVSGNGVSITTTEPNFGFDMVNPHMGAENPNNMDLDLQSFSTHNGKRKYNEIDGAPVTGAV